MARWGTLLGHGWLDSVHVGQDVFAEDLGVGLVGHQVHGPLHHLGGEDGRQVVVQSLAVRSAARLLL